MKYFTEKRLNLIDGIATSSTVAFMSHGEWFSAGMVFFLGITLSLLLETYTD